MKRQKMGKAKKDSSSSLEQFPWADLLEPTLTLDAPLTYKRKKKHLKEIVYKLKTEHQRDEAIGTQVLRRENSAVVINIDSSSEKDNSGKDLGRNKPNTDSTPPAPKQ